MTRQPVFAVVSVLVLAIGIGAMTSIFSIVDHVLLRPLPYPEPDRLFYVWLRNSQQQRPQGSFSAPAYLDYAARSKSFSQLTASRHYGASWTGDGPPVRVMTHLVTPNYFGMLDLRPSPGRGFLPEEGQFGRGQVVVLTERFWRSKMGRAPGVIGRRILLDKEPHEIVGIQPDTPGESSGVDMYVPAAFSPQELATREARYLTVMGRLRPGVTHDQAESELRSIAAAVAKEHPVSDGGWEPYLRLAQEEEVGQMRRPLLVLFAAVGFLLLVACSNLANLTLARALARQKEVAVRAALGAHPWQIFRHALAESLVLSVAGSVAGVVVARWILSAVKAWSLMAIPRLESASIDLAAFAFAFALAMLTGLLFGSLPAWMALRLNLAGCLRDEARGGTTGRSGSFLRSLLVVAQVALSVILLVGAGLLVRTVRTLTRIDPGFNPQGVLTCRATLPDAKYSTPESRAQYVRTALDKLHAIGGVAAAGVTTSLPLMQVNWMAEIVPEGRTDLGAATQTATYNAISPRYLDAAGIRIMRGRGFSERDDLTSPAVLLISEALERAYYRGLDPVGRFLALKVSKFEFRAQIVGVVRDVRHLKLEEPPRIAVYQPHAQLPWPFLAFAIRSSLPPETLSRAVVQAFRETDSEVPVDRIMPLKDLVDRVLAQQRLAMTLLSVFSSLAIALTAVGLYGVLAVAVSQRTREFGVRMALGASRRDILRMVIGEGLRLSIAGLVAGLLCTPLTTESMARMLYGVKPFDPLTLSGVAILLLVLALLACAAPALRASRVDPGVALRES